MSCNGCRVLRKGCAEDCALRPCLQWIDSSESQANATLFLAKFYGRAGLINLINAGPAHLHPETFKSLLYEACGRIIDPVNGSVGLMSSDNWDRCQAAVEAVLLRGTPVLMTQLSGDRDFTATAAPGQYPIIPLHGCDIRHLRKNSDASVHRIRSRNRFKRSADHGKSQLVSFDATEFMSELESKFTITGWNCGGDYKNFEEEVQERAPSHDSLSVETVELALANRDDPAVCGVKPEPESCEIELDLTLRLNPIYMSAASVIEVFDGET